MAFLFLDLRDGIRDESAHHDNDCQKEEHEIYPDQPRLVSAEMRGCSSQHDEDQSNRGQRREGRQDVDRGGDDQTDGSQKLEHASWTGSGVRRMMSHRRPASKPWRRS
jgi:hypothetical protein